MIKQQSSISRLPDLILLLLFIPCQSSYDPICPEGYSGFRAGPGCKSFFICANGAVVSPITECGLGTIFNEAISVCDLQSNFECSTTATPTTPRPTHSPTPRLFPTTVAPSLPPQTRSPSANVAIENVLDYAKHDINTKLFIYQSGWSDLDWVPSTQYRYDGFLSGLQVMYLEGVGDLSFYLGEDVVGDQGTVIGLVNIAAFLAQSMKETIKYDACDENNWDVIDGKYPLSNACGQLEQSYQNYTCPAGSEHMQCDYDPNMEIKATTNANWYGATAPLFCAPKSKMPFTGYWDYSYTCDFPWKDPPEYCSDYPGQKGGQFVNDDPIENKLGRTDVEGCCWWGRGVIQTTGLCNFGILNYYLGKRAAEDGRVSRYPHINFCKDPGAICGKEYPELKWIAGLFYWTRSLQTYDDGWNYLDNLKSFVKGGLKDDSFIDAVSGIVNRGCHNPPCGTGPLDGGPERKDNFQKVLEILLESDGSPRKFNPDKQQTDPNPIRIDEEEEVEDWSEIAAEQMIEEEEEEEDWSNDSATTSIANKLYCGETRDDAISNCGRNGYECPDGVCLGSNKCFMVGESCAEEEAETIPSTAKPIPETNNTPPPSSPTTPASSLNIPVNNNLGLKAQYCLKSLASLEADCASAKICESTEDCPAGQFCWGERMCGSVTATNEVHPTSISPTSRPTTPLPSPPPETYSPTEPWLTYSPTVNGITFDISNTYWCGGDRVEAATTCHKRCRGGTDSECNAGEKCYAYTSCEMEQSLPPSPPTTPQPTTPQLTTPQPTTLKPTQNPTQPPTTKPDEVQTDTTQSTAQLFCASNIAELESSCDKAESCLNGPCSSGLFCFPFTCTVAADTVDDKSPTILIDPGPAPEEESQNPTQQAQANNQVPAENEISVIDRGIQCPQSEFQGYHASTDCKEYFWCNMGEMTTVQVCPAAQKFDKVRSKCYQEEYVNTFCYGPPLEKEQAELCRPNYSGWESRNACREYYYCDRGFADVIYDCGPDLLFDKTLELCNFAHKVKCTDKYGNPINPMTNKPTPRPTNKPQKQQQTTPVQPQPSPTNTASIVPAESATTLVPTKTHSPSWAGGGEDEDKSVPTTNTTNVNSATPTVVAQNKSASAIPPWLQMNTIMNDGGNLISPHVVFHALLYSSFVAFCYWPFGMLF